MPKSTLSKSRFKLAVECPTKAYYSRHSRYVNSRDNDDFLQALADGGFQIGELARQMALIADPSSVEVEARDESTQIAETQSLLSRTQVTVFEGTLQHQNFVARVDILRKNGNGLDLIEVKSKSFNSESETFVTQNGQIRSEWRPYLEDVAFQTWVCRQAFPTLSVRPLLMLVDPSVPCSIDRLGAMIRATRGHDGRSIVTVSPELDLSQIESPLMREHDVTQLVETIIHSTLNIPGGKENFSTFIHRVAESIASDRRIDPIIGRQCRQCEFYCDPSDRTEFRRSGWSECMESQFPGSQSLSRNETVFSLYRAGSRIDELLGAGKLKLADVDPLSLPCSESVAEITLDHRHRLQVSEAQHGFEATYILDDVMEEAISQWRFPLHFIDFETTRPVLPFTAGRRPNEQLLFQFSHHKLLESGQVIHDSECLITDPGVVPNEGVVRALRAALSADNGTVIHWWDHERVVLKDMAQQIDRGNAHDRQEMIAFIDKLVGKNGPGRLVDIGRLLVAKAAFIAGTDGRSSIKKVLQALLSQSPVLRRLYENPIYGSSIMPSRNFHLMDWWRARHGKVADPYSLLGELLPDLELDRIARSAEEGTDFVNNGGAAMVAYGLLQYSDLAPAERFRLRKQLLRYCELDTLAMVMVFQALVGRRKRSPLSQLVRHGLSD